MDPLSGPDTTPDSTEARERREQLFAVARTVQSSETGPDGSLAKPGNYSADQESRLHSLYVGAGLTEEQARYLLSKPSTRNDMHVEDPHAASRELRLEHNVFNVLRGIKELRSDFGPELIREVDRLGRRSVILMGGAGASQFEEEYLRIGKVDDKASFKSVGLKKPPQIERIMGVLPDPSKFDYIEGDFAEIPDARIGKVDLAIDDNGVLAYTRDLRAALAKYFRLLKRGRPLLVNIDHSPFEAVLDTWILTREGERLDLYEWLNRQSGLEVEVLKLPPGMKRQPYDTAFRIRVRNPRRLRMRNLALLETNNHPPPFRFFVEVPD